MAIVPTEKRAVTRALTIDESKGGDAEAPPEMAAAEGEAIKRTYSEAAGSVAEESSLAEVTFLLRDIQG